jgi:hypothetical protein
MTPDQAITRLRRQRARHNRNVARVVWVAEGKPLCLFGQGDYITSYTPGQSPPAAATADGRSHERSLER